MTTTTTSTIGTLATVFQHIALSKLDTRKNLPRLLIL